MRATKETVQEHLKDGERIWGVMRCSLNIFIHRQVNRPGLLAATDERLIFCGDSLAGDEILEVYPFENIKDIRFKKGFFRNSVIMDYQYDVIKFKHLLTTEAKAFIDQIRERIK